MKKWMKYLGMLALCICCMFVLKPTTVNAAMADEAEDYELETEYKGRIEGYSERYFKFTISEKSYVTVRTSWKKDSSYADDCEFQIYSSDGKLVLRPEDVYNDYNNSTGEYSGSANRILKAGTYYLQVGTGSSGSSTNVNFSFRIQAEKQIKFEKGTIKSLKSNKKGQMTIKCKSAKNAIGYRIQYSTDYKFKKGVKTYYSPTATATIKKLKAGKYYYVKVCPFTVYDDGSYVFGQNSYVKKVYIKKK